MYTLGIKEATEAGVSTLRLVTASRSLVFLGEWHVTDEVLGECLLPLGLPVSFDYLVHFENNNHLVYPDDLEAFRTALAAWQKKKVMAFEFRVINHQGQIRRLQGHGRFMTRREAHVARWAVSMRRQAFDRQPSAAGLDRSQLDHPLQHDHRLMESVIQSDIIALSVLRPVYNDAGHVQDFQWIMANKLLMAIASGQPVVGKLYTEVFPSAKDDGVLDILRDVQETGRRKSNEVYYQDHNIRGWFRQVYVRTQEYVIVSAEDITVARQKQEQIVRMSKQLAQQAQAQYEALFRSIDQGFAIVRMVYDATGRAVDFVFEQVNPALGKLTGLADLAGMSMRTLWPTDPREWIKVYDRVARTQVAQRFTMPHGTDNQKFYEVYAFVTGDPKDGRVAVLLSDVTARKAAERQLQALNDKLQEMDRAKTRFFGNVSHEFRTPLTLILGPLRDVARQGRDLPPDQRQKLSIAERNVLRLQKLVNSLLDFSRAEAGRLDALFQPTRLAEFTADIASNFRPVIEQAGLKLVVKADTLPEPVYINREMWEKIVLNLLSNAFKFTHQGKIEVRVRAKKFYVQLIVRDTGVGIAARNLPRIFERFVRFDNPQARAYEGSGIGLALVKELVEMHQGTIKAESEEGQGSTFTVTIRKGKVHLPARQVFETTAPLAEHSASALFVEEAGSWQANVPDKLAPRRGQRHGADDDKPLIMIVDDNADMRAYLADILSVDYRVTLADNGRTALESLEQGTAPALIITDVMMPRVDGYSLVSAVGNNPQLAPIPVIILSAYTGEDALVEAMQRGAVDFLDKPFSPRTLRALVEARLRPARGVRAPC